MLRVRNGHPMMSRVTGMGCTASALTGTPFRPATWSYRVRMLRAVARVLRVRERGRGT